MDRRLARILVCCGLAVVVMAATAQAKIWTVSGTKGFTQGKLHGLSVLSSGELVLGPSVSGIAGLDADYVWDLERSGEGAIYLGTGGAAMVAVLEGDDLRVLHRSSEKHVLSVLPMPDGSVLAATAPRGIIYRIDAQGTVTVFKELPETYVWDMALANDGAVFCATGPHGQVLQIDAQGEVTEVFRAPQKHILCMEVDASGEVLYLGTEPNGLVLRVERNGRPSLLLDADESEVRCLVLAEDGTLYVGTAQTAEGGTPAVASAESVSTERESMDRALLSEGPQVLESSGAPNSVYRIGPDGAVTQMARMGGTLVLSLVLTPDGELLAGTGTRGRLASIDPEDATMRVALDFASSHVSAMVLDADGNAVVATSNPGALWRTAGGYGSQGSFVSEPHDAGQLSDWGRVGWRALQPAGTTISVSLRTGNSRRPDPTWSEWSEPINRASGGPLELPKGRFAQLRCELGGNEAGETPSVFELSVSYLQVNQRPVVRGLQVDGEEQRRGGKPEQNAGREAPKSPTSEKRVIRWSAADPNEDTLVFDLYYRGVEEADWKVIREGITGETNYEWDTSRVPDGHYVVRLVASDRLSRPPQQALTGEQVTPPMVVDNGRPEIMHLRATQGVGGIYVLTGLARDAYTPLAWIRVSRNGQEWDPVFPEDGLLDSTAEEFTYRTDELERGEHVFVFAASDLAGNVGSGKVLLTVK